MKVIGVVKAVLTGRAAPYAKPDIFSAIDKKSVSGTIKVSAEGLEGDEQGDRRFHGGIDKAVNFYSYEHYHFWRRQLGAMPLLDTSGAFGENLSTVGMTEDDVCLGDQLRIGTVLLEISQTRQPCWKLNHRFGVQDMALLVQQSLRTGFYCRVLNPGILMVGDAIKLVARPHPNWSLRRFLILLYQNTLDVDSLNDALNLPLVPTNRKLIENRLFSNCVEDWSGRIKTPESIDG
ncbi:MAG: MOSC domain-containing protein [Methylotenera sp.]|jgi:MOSC domain-containing protein YiiM|nr:MOSC domain-containing protein [Methylotenera sp.]HPM50505.1 MOSC domain-containing protein [Methylotenera sp.]